MMNPAHLVPGVRAETFTYANGRQVIIYRAPYRSEGPALSYVDGTRVLCYMFAEYVFRWSEGVSRIRVGHGVLGGNMDLGKEVTIIGRWSPARLVEFAQDWVAEHLKKYEIR